MTGIEYQNLAMRTNDYQSSHRLKKKFDENSHSIPGYDTGGILNGCLGLAGETGEFNDVVKKWIFHEKPLDEEHAKKELSDVLWYCAMICQSFGWNLDEIMKLNIEKLEKRYPEGFDTNKSNNRKAGDV